MTVDVKLVKKSTIYEKDGIKQRGTNLYLQVGSEYVPIQVVFFPNDKCEGRDPAFAGRMAILTAIAEELPPKPNQKERNVEHVNSGEGNDAHGASQQAV